MSACSYKWGHTIWSYTSSILASNPMRTVRSAVSAVHGSENNCFAFVSGSARALGRWKKAVMQAGSVAASAIQFSMNNPKVVLTIAISTAALTAHDGDL